MKGNRVVTFQEDTGRQKQHTYHINQAKLGTEQLKSWGEVSQSTIGRRDLGIFTNKI